MVDLEFLKRRNAERWADAKLTREPEFAPVARRLVAAKSRYQAVERKTGVPWYFIAVAHQRESSQNWNGSLAQGDPWNQVSTHVPKGRGPFNSWEDAAVDALVNCPPYAANNKDWSIGGLLTMLERYNGLGYASGPKDIETEKVYPPQPSPYIWSGTNQYVSGKYVRDHVFKPDVVDRQLGCAGLLLAMQKLDASIKFGSMKPAPGRNTVAASVVVTGGAAATVAPNMQWLAGILVVTAIVAIAVLIFWKKRASA